jgi:hypothetical protein
VRIINAIRRVFFYQTKYLSMDNNISLSKAKQSLEGLSVGDAFGELCFRISPYETTTAQLPSGIWRWTDDTYMALSIVEVLEK